MNGSVELASRELWHLCSHTTWRISSSMPFSLTARLNATIIGLRYRNVHTMIKKERVRRKALATITAHCGEEH
jgi:hypothetical protein